MKNNDYLNRRLDGDSLVILHSLECTAQESPTSTKLGNFNMVTFITYLWIRYWKLQARIGNSVPPNLMKAIALHIKENILKQI